MSDDEGDTEYEDPQDRSGYRHALAQAAQSDAPAMEKKVGFAVDTCARHADQILERPRARATWPRSATSLMPGLRAASVP